MTDKRISPLQWLSTKFASLNHSHSEYLTSHQDITGKEDKSNKVTGILSDSNTDTEYPSAKSIMDTLDDFNSYVIGSFATKSSLNNKENISNKSSSITTDTGSTSKYTTVKAVEDYAQPKGNYLTQHQSLTGYLQTSDVKDNLTSTDTNKPLSAKQGKELKTLIDNKPTVTVDSTWIANSTNPIQSKEIKTALDGKSNVIDFYYDSLTDELVINTSTETDFEDLILKEDKSNKVSSWSNTPNDNHYPSEKLVKDYIDEKIGDILEYINS